MVKAHKPVIYIAAPMRGIPDFNFPAFDEAEEWLTKLFVELGLDWEIISPANIDRSRGVKDESGVGAAVSVESFQECMKIDLAIVAKAEVVFLLKGWEKSTGANNEVFVANACGVPLWQATYTDGRLTGYCEAKEPLLPPLLFPSKVDPPQETILQEADRIVATDRQNVYGHPYYDFSRTARFWTAHLFDRLVEGAVCTPEDVALMMTDVKRSRLANSPDHRDSMVDIGGYLKTYALVRGKRHELELDSN